LHLLEDLGAGKTHLVQGVAKGLGVAEPVTSPTFTVLAVHPGPLTLYHFDLYRLRREDELEDVWLFEMLEADGVSIIEWGDRFPDALPDNHLLVRVHDLGGTCRRFELSGAGASRRGIGSPLALRQ